MIQGYKSIIFSYVSFSSMRMLIGASSTVYMLASGLTLFDVGMIKSSQAIAMLVLGFGVGVFSDAFNRKMIYLISLLFAICWLYLMYLGGEFNQLIYFYLAELCNALSLTFWKNNVNAYLIDQFYKQKKDGKLNTVLGSLGYYSFLGMAFASLLGGWLYGVIESKLFLYTAVLLAMLLMLSTLFLPSVRNKTAKGKISIRKVDFLIILRKIARYKGVISLFLASSLYFQILIQYWQPIISVDDMLSDKAYWLGITLFLMMMAQSISGKVVEKNIHIAHYTRYIMLFAFGLGIFSIQQKSLVFLVMSLCMIMFSLRYIIVRIDASLHERILSKFRAKYDMVLNTLVQLFTALLLLLVGLLSELYNASIILYVGAVSLLLIIGVRLLFSLKDK